MSVFELDDTNDVLKNYYEENLNYKVIVNDERNKRCIIFFSGNGLYYPNTEETFRATVIEKDRYEWERVAKSPILKEYYGMVIFVRDIYKTHYVRGINSEVSSVDKLLAFLKSKTEGYSTITCGNSAGGYMAVIAGYFLHAEYIFSFGGQWSIESESQYYLNKYRDEYGKYYNITKYAKENVLWFYSALNENDNMQKQLLGNDFDKILSFAIASKYHGDLILFPCYEKILVCSLPQLKRLGEKYHGKLISQRKFAKELLSGRELFQTCINDIIRHHKSLQIITSFMIKK